MKRIRAAAAILVIAVFAFAFAGCSSNKFIGKWTSDTGVYMDIKSDGTCDMRGQSINVPGATIFWEHSDNKLKFKAKTEGISIFIAEYTVKSITDKEMILDENGTETKFTKS